MTIAGHQVDDAMFSYIAQNLDADTCKLLLKAEPHLSFDKSFAILQIECRRKAKAKIPELLANERFLFPKAISAEQCTHEVVAQFHASLFNNNDSVLDVTMGLGVDDYYIAQSVKKLTAVEIDSEIAEVGKYNFSFLAPNVTVVNANSVEYLNTLDDEKRFDAIFIDPARRGDSGKRLYGFADCQPNVLELLPSIQQRCKRLFIKASPMLDVTQSIRDLGGYLTDVWAVSIKNECKELFFKLDFETKAPSVTLHAMNHDGTEWLHFSTQGINDNTTLPVTDVSKGNFLYEPNASIMKLGCYNALEQAFKVPLIAANSHLMVSDSLIEAFPGRRFRITEVIPFKSKEIKQLSKRYKQINVATRNFRLSAEALKKRLGVQDGGSTYLFATTLPNGEQILILCEKA
jgi:hypothetical protein